MVFKTIGAAQQGKLKSARVSKNLLAKHNQKKQLRRKQVCNKSLDKALLFYKGPVKYKFEGVFYIRYSRLKVIFKDSTETQNNSSIFEFLNR